jgi:hypothetical protein
MTTPTQNSQIERAMTLLGLVQSPRDHYATAMRQVLPVVVSESKPGSRGAELADSLVRQILGRYDAQDFRVCLEQFAASLAPASEPSPKSRWSSNADLFDRVVREYPGIRCSQILFSRHLRPLLEGRIPTAEGVGYATLWHVEPADGSRAATDREVTLARVRSAAVSELFRAVDPDSELVRCNANGERSELGACLRHKHSHSPLLEVSSVFVGAKAVDQNNIRGPADFFPGREIALSVLVAHRGLSVTETGGGINFAFVPAEAAEIGARIREWLTVPPPPAWAKEAGREWRLARMPEPRNAPEGFRGNGAGAHWTPAALEAFEQAQYGLSAVQPAPTSAGL